MEFTLVPLQKNHSVKTFDCGNAVLNEYLRRYALKNDRLSIGKTFVALDDENRIAGYLTISGAQIDKAVLPEPVQMKLPRYPVPALRIARLAVDKKRQGQGTGAWLLRHAFIKALQIADMAGIYAVIVDAIDENAKGFYLKYGFIPFQAEPLALFLPLETIRQAL
ncbi:MAG: GNAT family N-acetyltransferase [Spirochaetaceae bacterium]|jgi:GNAT superfamily N-acetyltransferase|nr:GNAT family N-acetyltransferase [Spirochaetaceae bacterium]